MNAPMHYTTLAVELLPIASIVVSTTPEQARRRAGFTDAELQELAASIRPTGVLQPILVRPIDGGKYEIVAGERRYLASQLAGFDSIPANIREMDDGEVLFAQIVENLQRKGLTVMEEAEGYTRLMKLRDMNADAIGNLIGKSRSYVYTRTKLLDLCPEAQAALAAGEIDASRALVLSRYPGIKLQRRILEYATNFRLSYRDFLDEVRRCACVALDDAPFRLDDHTLEIEHQVGNGKSWGGVPACSACEWNSSTDPELREALGADICTDTRCYEAKCKSALAITRHALESRGVTVHTGDAARQYDPIYWRADYVDMQGTVDKVVEYDDIKPAPDEAEDEAGFKQWDAEADAWEKKTVAEVFGHHDLTTEYVELRGRIINVVAVEQLAPIIKKQYGISIHVPNQPTDDEPEVPRETPEQRAAREAKEKQARQIDSEYRQRLFIAVAAKIKSPLKKPDLLRVAKCFWDQFEYDLDDDKEHVLEVVFGACPPAIDKMDDAELLKFICMLPALEEINVMIGKPCDLLDLATRYKVDAKKLKTTVTAEVKAAAKQQKQ